MIDAVYAAATDPARWGGFLRGVASETRSEIAAIHIQDLAAGKAAFVAHHGSDGSTFGTAYETYYAARNVYMLASAAQMQTGFVTAGERIVPDAEALRTEYVNDFLRPQGVLHNIGACIERRDSRIATFSTLRRLGQPAYEDGVLDLVSLLLPHMRRALAVRERLRSAESAQWAAESALDRLDVALLVLDARGTIRFRNRTAESLLASADGLVAERSGPAAARPAETRRLRALIASAIGASGATARLGGAMLVSRPSAKPPLHVLVAPLAPDATLLGADGPSALMFVTDPSAAAPPLERTLCELYGLTPAEAGVAVRLVTGAPLGDVADELGISMNTARTHLRRVFAKTRTRGQSDLVRLLLRGAAVVHF